MTVVNRISRHQMFMEMAQVAAKRSTCFRLNVGAIITHNNSVVSIGYNGAPSGEPHCQGALCDGWGSKCTRTIHAERNAIDRLPAGIGRPLDLYVTDSPCAHCYDYIVQDMRVSRIFFGTPYRITDHLQNSLFEGQIDVYRVLPSGVIIEWTTGAILDE